MPAVLRYNKFREDNVCMPDDAIIDVLLLDPTSLLQLHLDPDNPNHDRPRPP